MIKCDFSVCSVRFHALLTLFRASLIRFYAGLILFRVILVHPYPYYPTNIGIYNRNYFTGLDHKNEIELLIMMFSSTVNFHKLEDDLFMDYSVFF